MLLQGKEIGLVRTLFTFDTTHHALWAEETAQTRGIPCEVVPAPAAAAARCNLALQTLEDRIPALQAALESEGVSYRLYRGEE